ncbi:MAG: hypothetical protein JWP43_1748 [Ramlibacter sp.]|nr:hypothetical protein [Ramlibacter sp.]
MNRSLTALAFAAVSSLCATSALAQPAKVELTWMSIANWDMKINGKRILMDAYISRLPNSLFVAAPGFPNDMYAFTKAADVVDVESIKKVRDAEVGSDKVDYLLVGHSHWDHSWDTPTWSKLTGAPLIGGISSCMQAAAQGVAANQCRSVNGGEKIDLGDGVTMRVVRWNHSGDATNPIQHFPRELYRPPVPDANGGLRAGVGEDYPNGGGNRAFLFTINRPGEQQVSFFMNNSASAFDLDKDIVIDGVNYGSPIGNLAAAMKDAGLTQVDAWVGTGGKPVAEIVVPVIHPKTYIPNHWDGLFNSFWKGLPFPFKDEPLQAYLQAQKVDLIPQKQYFDKYILTKSGVQTDANLAVKRKLGFEGEQKFSRAMTDAVALVPSTSMGDDCGEGFAPPTPWANAFAVMQGADAARTD